MSDCEQCAALRAEVEKLRALVVKTDEAIERQQQDLEEAADRAADCDILRAEVKKLKADLAYADSHAAKVEDLLWGTAKENEKLKAALNPFADESLWSEPQHEFVTVKRSDCDRARAAITQEPKK